MEEGDQWDEVARWDESKQKGEEKGVQLQIWERERERVEKVFGAVLVYLALLLPHRQHQRERGGNFLPALGFGSFLPA
jgi:hypothetical protein